MKISYKWLCELIPGLEKITARDLAHKLTFSGLEVEGIEDFATKFRGIVVGEVLTKDKHPNADKLSVCKVSDGMREYQVVCGAPNVEAGRKYPFATLGTVMPGGLEIKPVKLRQVDSYGMLCSAKELELSAEAAGLMTLDSDFRTGQAVAEALGLNDIIFELNVTPNRGDALSHWGVARDVAALTGLEVQIDTHAAAIQTKPGVQIKVEAGTFCRRFSASGIAGVKVAPSPQWLSRRIESLGVRSINNIVDATNYVMLLTGHPVHAYDRRDVEGGTLIVRAIAETQKFTTLDGVDRDLIPGDLVICDAKRVVGLAGVMGGANSEIKADTTDVILEVAHFAPDSIRKTARRLGLHSDSSYRFERSVNPETIVIAHEVLSRLIVQLAGGTATSILDVYPDPFKRIVIEFNLDEIQRLTGIAVDTNSVVRILTSLQCDVSGSANSVLNVTVPLSRSDLTRPADLVEEVARIQGLDQIPAVMPRRALSLGKESKLSSLAHEIKSYWVGQGFHETVHYSFGDVGYFKQVLVDQDESDWVKLKNPISDELAVMRPSLLPALLQCYQNNKLRTERGIRFFEMRHVYSKSGSERTVLAGLYTGRHLGRNRFGHTRDCDVFDGKGWLEDFFSRARIQVTMDQYSVWPFHPGQSLNCKSGDSVLAVLGALHPSLLQDLKIRESLYYFEIEIEAVAQMYGRELPKFAAPSSLPAVYRDLAVIVPEQMTFAELAVFIERHKPNILKNFSLFDEYRGEGLPAGKKSLAFSMLYEDSHQSLTDEVVNQQHFVLVQKLQEKLGVELR